MSEETHTTPVNFDVPETLEYSGEHVWVERGEDDDYATIGITEYAANQLGELVFVDLPEVGDSIESGDELAQLEASKAVESLISPVSGVIKYVNSEVSRDASVINDDPYGEGWIVKIELDDDDDLDLLDAEQYEHFIKSENA